MNLIFKPTKKRKKVKAKPAKLSFFKPAAYHPKRSKRDWKLIDKNPFGDKDGDRVPNIFDCKPYNKKKQGKFSQNIPIDKAKYITMYHGTTAIPFLDEDTPTIPGTNKIDSEKARDIAIEKLKIEGLKSAVTRRRHRKKRVYLAINPSIAKEYATRNDPIIYKVKVKANSKARKAIKEKAYEYEHFEDIHPKDMKELSHGDIVRGVKKGDEKLYDGWDTDKFEREREEKPEALRFIDKREEQIKETLRD